MNDAQANNTSHDLSGRTLGAYRLIYRLGRGGMAEVYLADQDSLRRKVAVKVLRHDLARQPDYVKRFHNEAQAAAALIHANIVQIYEVGCVDGIHFIAQEYVPGQTVKQLVHRHGPLPVPQIVSILGQMTAALGKAASGNIVHRDIKPENILLSPVGEAKVADFGLARVVDPERVDLTQAGLTMGTPLYMSPEQVEGRKLDPRSDLYSCGVTAFFMLTGRPPFEGETSLSVAVQHLHNAPPDLAELRPDAPSDLVRIVHRLLAKRPKDRYRSASELLNDLRGLSLDGAEQALPLENETWGQADVSSIATGSQATQQLQAVMATEAMPTASRSTRWRWPLALVAVAGLIGGAIAHATRSSLVDIDPNADPAQERFETAKDQYWHALRLNTVEAWNNVINFHPPSDSELNRYYASRARCQIARLLLFNHQQPERAIPIFRELADPNQEPEFRVFGHAGLAVISYRRDELEQAREHLYETKDHRQLIPPGQLRDELSQVAEALGSP